MAKQEMFHWRVYYIKDTPAEYIGSMDAPDEEAATEIAAVKYAVSADKRDYLFAGKVVPDVSFPGDIFGV